MEHTHTTDNYLNFLLILLAIFIQQSSVLFGINLSFADFIVVLLIFHLLMKYPNSISMHHYLEFFIILFIYRIVISIALVILDPILTLSIKEFLNSTIKFCLVAVYFLLSYNLFKFNKGLKVFLVSYIASSTMIGLFCIIGDSTHSSLITKLFFFDDVRSKGLMNDPNYFAMTQIITLILIFNFISNNILKYITALIVIGSIFTTGSKTAMITLILLGLGFTIIKIYKGHITTIISTILFLLLLTILFFYDNNFNGLQLSFTEKLPSVSRMFSIFQNGTSAIDDSGSDRITVWINAINIIKHSLGFGIGLIDYVHIGTLFGGVNLVAHNTYLQLISEWGILFAVIFMVYMVYIFIKLLKLNNSYNLTYFIAIFLVVAFYFLTVSFNNSRYIAFLFGIMAVIIEYKKTEIRGDKLAD